MTDGYNALARGVVADALRFITTPIPRGFKKRKEWIENHNREVRWFLDADRSAKWCEWAGLDWDATVSRLRARGLLEIVETTVPTHFDRVAG